MINLKDETIEAIKDSGHELSDVMFVGTNDGKERVSIDRFLRMSDFVYDNSYGSGEIRYNLIVYFKDNSILTRLEYDGSEEWEFIPLKHFKDSDNYKELKALKISTLIC